MSFCLSLSFFLIFAITNLGILLLMGKPIPLCRIFVIDVDFFLLNFYNLSTSNVVGNIINTLSRFSFLHCW